MEWTKFWPLLININVHVCLRNLDEFLENFQSGEGVISNPKKYDFSGSFVANFWGKNYEFMEKLDNSKLGSTQ